MPKAEEKKTKQEKTDGAQLDEKPETEHRPEGSLDLTQKRAIPDHLTAQERRMLQIFESGEAESLPTISEVIERIKGNELELTKWSPENPTGIMLPGKSYLWVGNDAMQTELYKWGGGGLYDVVRRVNHGHIPSHAFDDCGSICIRKQLHLCYTNKDIKDKRDQYLKRQLSMKVDEAESGQEKDIGGARLERFDKAIYGDKGHYADGSFRSGEQHEILGPEGYDSFG